MRTISGIAAACPTACWRRTTPTASNGDSTSFAPTLNATFQPSAQGFRERRSVASDHAGPRSGTTVQRRHPGPVAGTQRSHRRTLPRPDGRPPPRAAPGVMATKRRQAPGQGPQELSARQRDLHWIVWAIEIKRCSVPRVSRGFHTASEDVMPDRRVVVHGADESYPLRDGVEAVGTDPFFGLVPHAKARRRSTTRRSYSLSP